MSCPAVDQLLAFTTGELPEPRAAEIEGHIDECAECRAVLSNVARGGPPPSLGRYRIDTVLGSGGMGIVYRGFDPQLARPVAIKVVRRAGEDVAGRQRLVREAQALARLSHPNVCHVYDVGTQDEEVWVAMELIDGVHLRQWADEGRRRDEVMEALLGAAEGIAAAHAVGLVHRDIKPENVLMTRDGRAIVTDFGLARHEDAIDPNAPTVASDPHLTATGAIAGTPAYLAPEQLLGDPIDARVDQFAWAVMAWELLTGSRPFPIVFAVRVEAVRAGVKLPPSLPAELGSALARAMAAAPADRFPTMREVIEAFRAQPAPAKPEPFVPLRGRGPAIAGLAVLAASTVAVGAWLWPRGDEPRGAVAAAPQLPAQPTAQSTQPAPSAHAAVPAPPTTPPPAPSTPAPAAETTPEAPRRVRDAGKAKPPKRVAASEPAARSSAPGVAAPVSPPAPPASTSPQISTAEPTGPVVSVPASPPRPRGPGYCRSCQVASADAFCVIPTDFEKPGRKSNHGVVDWGTVTKVDVEVGTFRDEPLRETVITLRGQRKTYRFTADFLATRVDTTVGALLAICPEGESDLYRLPGGPTDLTRAVITLSAPPNILPAARLGARHLRDIKLAAASIGKSLERARLEPDGRYLVHAKVHGVDGQRYRMDRYVLEVPRGMKNEDKLVPKNLVWMVVEKPVIEDTADGDKQLVVRAAAILDEVFP